jgi:hypothetical protein
MQAVMSPSPRLNLAFLDSIALIGGVVDLLLIDACPSRPVSRPDAGTPHSCVAHSGRAALSPVVLCDAR